MRATIKREITVILELPEADARYLLDHLRAVKGAESPTDHKRRLAISEVLNDVINAPIAVDDRAP